ncbi:hypothetical protein D3C72_2555440 [compost metagenome]
MFTVMPTSSRMALASLPVRLTERRSTSIRWLSVPPETIRRPSLERVSARAFALAMTCFW